MFAPDWLVKKRKQDEANSINSELELSHMQIIFKNGLQEMYNDYIQSSKPCRGKHLVKNLAVVLPEGDYQLSRNLAFTVYSNNNCKYVKIIED